MYRIASITRVAALAVAILLGAVSSQLHSTTYAFAGPDYEGEMGTPGNWYPSNEVPNSYEILAFFQSEGVAINEITLTNYSTLTAGEFELYWQYDETGIGWDFTISNSTLDLQGGAFSPAGMVISSPYVSVPVNMSLVSSSTMNITDGASGCSGRGTVNYTISNSGTSLNFGTASSTDTSVAGTSTFTLTDLGQVNFFGNTDANSATFTVGDGTAAESPTLTFADSSTADAATITANRGIVQFVNPNNVATPSSVGTSQISLTNHSQFIIDHDISISNFAIDNTSTLKLNGSTGKNTFTFSPTSTTTVDFFATITDAGATSANSGIFAISGGSVEFGTNTNFYGGGTQITDDATLIIQALNSLPATGGVAIGSGSTLEFNNAATGTYTGSITGLGNVTATSTGTLALTQANYQGVTTVSGGGTLILANSGSTYGTIDLSNSSTINIIQSSNTTGTISGEISGAGAAVFSGAGSSNGGTIVLTYSGNTYTGGTTINDDAILKITHLTGLPAGYSVAVETGSTLDFASGVTTGSFTGAISGAGNIQSDIGSSHTLELTSPGYSGATTVNSGTLILDSPQNLSGAISIGNNATLELNLLTATTTVDAALSGPTGSTLTKNGTYNLILEDIGSLFHGDINVNDGELILENTAALSCSLVLATSTELDFNQQSSAGTFSGTITGPASSNLTKDGSQDLTIQGLSSTLFQGSISVNDGTLILENATTTVSNSISIAGGAELDFNQSTSTGMFLASSLSGPSNSTLSKDGANDLTIESLSSSFSGMISLNDGTLVLLNATDLSSNSFALATSTTLEFNQQAVACTLTEGSISGPTGSAIAKDGSYDLTIDSLSSSFLGSININEGTLIFENITTQTNAITIASGAELDFNQATSTGTFTGTLSGPVGATLTKDGAHEVTIEGLSSSLFLGSININAGTLILENATTTISNSISMASVAEIDFNQQSVAGTFTGTITASSTNTTLAKDGTYALTLENLSYPQFAGSISINEGTLIFLDYTTALPNSIAIATSTTLEFDQQTVACTLSSGSISGPVGSNLAKEGSFDLTIDSLSSSFLGSIVINEGTLIFENAADDISNLISVADGAEVDFNQSTTAGTYTGEISGSSNSTLAKDGSYSLLVSLGSFQGNINVNDGELIIENATTTPNNTITIASGATLDFDQQSVACTLTGGTISGPVGSAIAKDGSFDLTIDSLSSSFLGSININEGILIFENITTQTNAITIASGAELDFNQSASTGTFTGTITASSTNTTLAKDGTNVLTIENLSYPQFSGSISINEGTLALQDSTALPNPISIASDAELDFNQQTVAGTLTGSTITGPSNSTLAKDGTYPLTVENLSTSFLGLISINAGTFVFENATTTIFNPITIANGATLEFDQESVAGTLTGGSITGPVGSTIEKSGTYDLTFESLSSSFLGSISINEGTFIFENATTTISNPISIASGATLEFDQQSVAGVLTGDAITGPSGSTIAKNGAYDLTVETLGSSFLGLISINEGTLIFDTITTTLNNSTFVADGAVLDFEQTSGTGTVTGLVSGTGDLVKDGAGTVIIGQSTLQGTTTINQGTLQFSSVPTSSNIVLSNSPGSSTVDFEQAASTVGTYSNTISGTGNFTVNAGGGQGTVVLTENNTYDGSTTIAGGTLLLDNITVPSSIITNNAALDIERTSGTSTFSNLISGTGNVVINSLNGNSGTVVYSITQPYTGSTTISGGTLLLDNVNLAGNSIINNSILDIEVSTGSISYPNVISGTGELLINATSGNTGDVILTATQSFSGDTVISNGALILENATLTNSDITNNALLDFEITSGSQTYSHVISGDGDLIINDEPVNTGTLVFSNTNEYTGITIIEGGTLLLDNVLLNSQIINNSVLDFEVTSANKTYGGAVTGPGQVVINSLLGNNGSLTFTGANAYTGDTRIDGGLLTLKNTSLPGNIINNALLDFTSTSGSLTYAGVISGSGDVLINDGIGEGTVIFTGDNLYQGLTSIGGGTLELYDTILLGDIHDDATLDFELTNGSSTYTGDISGSGDVIVNSGTGSIGALIFSGSNSYTGGTTVSNGSLQGDTESLQGAIRINRNATLIFDQTASARNQAHKGMKSPIRHNQNSATTYAGALSGSGTMSKIGQGLLNLTGNSKSFTGTTLVSEGTLAINNILGGDVQIYNGTTLAGTGTVGNDLLNMGGGTVAPGNNGKGGKLSVGGNYTQEDNAVYRLDFQPTSLLKIDGVATLAEESVLALIFPKGQLPTNETTSATILQTNEGIDGTFGKILKNNPLIAVNLIYQPKSIILTFSNAIASFAETSNQQAVAMQLQSITNPTPAEEALLVSLSQLTSTEARHSLDQLGAQPYTNTLLLAEAAGQRFISRLYDPLRRILENTEYNYPHCYGGFFPEFWAEITGAGSYFQGNKEADGFNTNGFQASGGLQVEFNSSWDLGIAGSYGQNYQNFYIDASGKNDSYYGGIYGAFHQHGFYILGEAVMGWTHSHIRRHIDVGDLRYTAKGNPKVMQRLFYTEVGCDLCCPGLIVQPFVGGEFNHSSMNKIAESGTSVVNVTVERLHHSNIYTRFGVHVNPIKTNRKFTYNVDIVWNYRCTTLDNSVNMHFQDFGTEFPIVGFDIDRNSIEGTMSLSYKLDRHWEIYLEATGLGWSNNISYSGICGIQANW